MTQRGLLLASAGTRGRNVARAIRSAGVQLEVVSNPADFKRACADGPAFVVVDAGDDITGERFHEAFLGLAGTDLPRRSLLFSDVTTREAFLDLLNADLLHHVIAASAPGSYSRIAVTLSKLLNGNIIGMEKYVPWGTQIYDFPFRRSQDKGKLLDGLAEFSNVMGIPSRLARLGRTVADEFLMNAIYDAPVDNKGNSLFADYDRTRDVELPEPHQARFRYCATGSALVVCIFDSFGSLPLNSVHDNLLRTLTGGSEQIRKGTAGAGVGLYMAFKSLSDWIINIIPNKGTEMIGFIRTSGTYRDHIAMPKSFHIFRNAE